VVDDDPFTRGSLSSLFRSVGLEKVKALASAAELLEIITRSGVPAGVFNLVVGSGSTPAPSRRPISKLPNLHAAPS
jgi:CheY-like chemotaxis protein